MIDKTAKAVQLSGFFYAFFIPWQIYQLKGLVSLA
jgi:hypothetical protein